MNENIRSEQNTVGGKNIKFDEHAYCFINLCNFHKTRGFQQMWCENDGHVLPAGKDTSTAKNFWEAAWTSSVKSLHFGKIVDYNSSLIWFNHFSLKLSGSSCSFSKCSTLSSAYPARMLSMFFAARSRRWRTHRICNDGSGVVGFQMCQNRLPLSPGVHDQTPKTSMFVHKIFIFAHSCWGESIKIKRISFSPSWRRCPGWWRTSSTHLSREGRCRMIL